MRLLESHRNLVDVQRAAQREASRLGHETVGPEHLLLGLVAQGGRAAEVLGGLGLGLETLRVELRRLQGEDLAALGIALAALPPLAPDERAGLTLTPRAEAALEEAEERRSVRGDDVLGPEHVLLALLAQPDGLARRALHALGVSPVDVERGLLAPRERLAEPAGALGAPGALVRVATARYTATPPARVWEVLSDPERLPEWTPAEEAEVVSGSGLGQRLRFHHGVRGRPVTAERTVDVWRPGERIGWQTDAVARRGRWTEAPRERGFQVALAPDGDGTRVWLELRYAPSALERLAAPLARRRLRRSAELWLMRLVAASGDGDGEPFGRVPARPLAPTGSPGDALRPEGAPWTSA